MRFGTVLTFTLAASIVPLSASANGAGVAGYTGKPTTVSPEGQSCNQCHGGGSAPQVSISGPATLTAGQSAEYALVVTTGQTRASGAVAGTDGAVLAPSAGGGLRDSFGEMVQDGSRAASGGEATFRFRVTAPTSGTTLTLWGVGLASNGSGTGGDRAAHVTREIAVAGGSTDPAPGSPSGGAPPDAGAGGAAGGEESAGSSSSTADPGDDVGGDDEDEPDDGAGPSSTAAARRRRAASPEPSVACASSPSRVSSSMVFGATSAVALGLLARRRRRP
ncbi:MAG: hypothetical protein KF850_19430 [Labilithrix sp.]|nr:hypothetical protein [Labilithrix sp.]MBX3214215.1 hypothetical protein [Labilithrix sp.]